MSYELSFSEEFFTGSDEYYEPSDKPTNVLQAIESLSDEEQIAIAKNILGVSNPELVIKSEMFAWEVLQAVRNTNTCSNLSVPVRVWIDSEGDYTVDIWDEINDAT